MQAGCTSGITTAETTIYITSDSTAATIANLLDAFAAGPLQYRYSFNVASVYAYYGSREASSVTWKNVETVGNLTGGANADFLVYQNGTKYEGKGGVDTFFADLSSWNEAVTWTNGADASNSGLSDEAVSTLGATHQVKVSGMERLLLLTGSGNDTITQNITGTNDEFRLGAGNDRLTLGGVSDVSNGNDAIDLGANDDTLTISGNSGLDTVDGGSGSDTLNLDWSANNSGIYMAFSIQKSDASWVHFGNHYSSDYYLHHIRIARRRR